MIRISGYLPEPYDDLDTEAYGNRQLQRTKSRTYKIVAWSAIVSGHDFFLGRYARGTDRTFYLFAALSCFSLPYNNALAAVLAYGAVAGHFLSVRSIAHMSEDAPVFQSATPASVLNVIYFPVRQSLLGCRLLVLQREPKEAAARTFRPEEPCLTLHEETRLLRDTPYSRLPGAGD